jgi:hypothetical protein
LQNLSKTHAQLGFACFAVVFKRNKLADLQVQLRAKSAQQGKHGQRNFHARLDFEFIKHDDTE